MKNPTQTAQVSAVIALLLASPLLFADGGNISKVNGSIRVESGQEVGSVETVNGGIEIEDSVRAGHVETVSGAVRIGRDSIVGSVESVNGGISMQQGAKARSLEVVNGGIQLDERVQIEGNVTSVNGGIKLARDVDVAGKIENVNGGIKIDGAHVGDGITTVTGDIEVNAGSRIEGGILVEKQSGLKVFKSRTPRITIGPDAEVNGTLRFEREVELHISNRAKVGNIEGATPIRED